MQNSTENNYDSESEISLSDIVEFVQDNWKQLIAAGIVGAVLGFGGWSFLGSYKAELILLNNTNTYGLDLVTWRTLQKSLPNLASQMLADEKLSSETRAMYRQMDDAAWWSKGVVPTYAISKADVKDLAGISKGLDGASTTILALNIYTGGNSSDSSINNARLAAKFIKSGGAYLQVKSILNAYEGEVIGTAADIQNQITSTEIEQSYLSARVKSLEELLKRFPGNAGLNQQMIDIKDADAKYLPITDPLPINW